MNTAFRAIVGTLLLAAAIAASCDRLYLIHARAPLVAPLDLDCARSAIARYAKRDVSVKPERRTGPGDSVAYVFDKTYRLVLEHQGGARLEADEFRINHPFRPGQADRIGAAFARLLREVRVACAGHTPSQARSLVVVSNDPAYEMWTVPGTGERVLMRWAPNPNTLRVDTLPTSAPRDYETPIQVHTIPIARPPDGFTIATDCWHEESYTPGRIVAIVRGGSYRDPALYTEATHAWELDLATLRITPANPDRIRCRNLAWWSTVAPAAWEEQLAAESFRPPHGRSRVYAYRRYDTQPTSSDVMFDVTLDANVVGSLAPSSFVVLDVPPGDHWVGCRGGRDSVFLEMAADSSYFVWLFPEWSATRTHPGISWVRYVDPRDDIRSARMLRTPGPDPPVPHGR